MTAVPPFLVFRTRSAPQRHPNEAILSPRKPSHLDIPPRKATFVAASNLNACIRPQICVLLDHRTL